MCWKKCVLGANHDLRVNNLVPTGSHTHSLLALEKLETDGTPVCFLRRLQDANPRSLANSLAR
jgi:hypothetical protein